MDKRSVPPAVRRALALAGAAILLVALAGPTSAAIVSRETYIGSDAWSYDDCGPLIDVTLTFGGDARIRSTQDPEAFLLHDRYWWREVHVRRSDGLVAVVSGRGNRVENGVTHLEGTIYRYTAVDAGALLTARAADGSVLFSDRGMVRTTFDFDTFGDGQPGGGQTGPPIATTFHGRFQSLVHDLCPDWQS
jgi:hypothetical protein